MKNINWRDVKHESNKKKEKKSMKETESEKVRSNNEKLTVFSMSERQKFYGVPFIRIISSSLPSHSLLPKLTMSNFYANSGQIFCWAGTPANGCQKSDVRMQ